MESWNMDEAQIKQIGEVITQTVNVSAIAVADLAAAFRRIAAQQPDPVRWVVFMRPEAHSALLPVRQRKLQPYIRQAWHTRLV